MGDAQRSDSDRQRAAFEYLLRGPEGNVLPAPKRLPCPPVIEEGRSCLKKWDMTAYNFDEYENRPLSRIFWKRTFDEFGDNDEFVPFFIDQVLDTFANSEYLRERFEDLESNDQINILFKLMEDIKPDKVDFACRTGYIYMAEKLAQILLINMFPGVKFHKQAKTYEYPLTYLAEEHGGPGTLYPLLAVSRAAGKKTVMSLHGWVKQHLEQAMLKLLPDEEITEGREWYFGDSESLKNKWQEHLTELYFMLLGAAFCVGALDEKMNHLVENAWTYKQQKGNMYIGLHPILRIADEDKVPTWAMTQEFDKKQIKKTEFLGPWVAEFYGRVFLSGLTSDPEKIFYKSPNKHWSFEKMMTKAITCKQEWMKEEKMKEQREAEQKEVEKRKSESEVVGGKAKRRRG